MPVPETITAVVDEELCVGCGTCAAACPMDAIAMTTSNGLFVPVIDPEKCTRCSLCVHVCPGYSVDFSQLAAAAFATPSDDRNLGQHLQCYLAHSTDPAIRLAGASGGVITQLLVFALENRLVDGVVVVRMRKDAPLVPESVLARTREEIISAAASKYCPVAVNEGLKQVLRENGRVAVVGLPCHIHGVRKAEQKMGTLRRKIALRIGLFCSHTVSFSGTEFLLRKLKVEKDQVAKIAYRGGGWPGALTITLKDDSNRQVPYVGRWRSYWPVFSAFFFTPSRCLMCPDETNELADLACGDAWLPELKNENVGESVVLARSKAGLELLTRASSAGVIALRSIEPARVQYTQASPLRFKKIDLRGRLALFQRAGRAIPKFKGKSGGAHSWLSWGRNLFALLNARASENIGLTMLLASVPFPLFRLYYGVYKLLSAA